MGINYASLVAALFLYYYESQFIAEFKKKTDPSKPHLVDEFNTSNNFRYSDDILALNNDDFNIYIKDI